MRFRACCASRFPTANCAMMLRIALVLALVLALVTSAGASVGQEGELRAILAEAMRENDAIRIERQSIAQENAALGCG